MRTEWVHCVAGHSWQAEVAMEHGNTIVLPGPGNERCQKCGRDYFDWGRYETVLAWKIPMVRVMEYVAEIKDAKERLERLRKENDEMTLEELYRTLLEEVVCD